MKVKVFRIWKMLENDVRGRKRYQAKRNLEDSITSLKSGWPYQLEGKTRSECKEMGYSVCEGWLIEEEREDPSNGN